MSRARPPARRRDSRAAVLRAAEREFAALDFSGVRVDAIARRAGVNKAMIYYHFGSKLGLYRTVVREGVAALLAQAREVLDRPVPPLQKLEAFVATLLAESARRPHLIPIVLRQVAGGGRQLDPEALRLFTGVFQVVRQILDEGRRRGDFRDLDPLLTHFTILGASILYIANEPLRVRIDKLKLLERSVKVPFGHEPFVRHLGELLRVGLCRPRTEHDHA